LKKAVSGFSSITDSLKIASKVGFGNFYRSITSRNTCKTCALGMGGQKGGMTWIMLTSLSLLKMKST